MLFFVKNKLRIFYLYQRARDRFYRYFAQKKSFLKKKKLKELKKYNQFFFDKVKVNRVAAENLYDEISTRIGGSTQEERSVHRLAFSALKIAGFSPENILEIGTSEGRTTLFLSILFPKSRIWTIELPEDDPLFKIFHPDGRHDAYEQFLSSNINNNIIAVRTNSLNLPKLNLPDKFDLIWLDGGHNYPEVSWDHFFCINMLSDDGWLFSDDVIIPEKRYKKHQKISDVYETIEYIKTRSGRVTNYLVKRETAFSFIYNPKYIAVIEPK